MNAKYKIKKLAFKKTNIRTSLVLMLTLITNMYPAAAATTVYGRQGIIQQAVSTLMFVAQADAHVTELHPDSNQGSLNYLEVEKANNRSAESYLRFSVTGVSGTIQSVKLRVYTTTNNSTNGPAVYGSNNAWIETGLTWNNRPARTTGALDNKTAINKNTWVEYDVASLVASNGTYSFILAGDSSDEIHFSSREGGNPPQLVVTTNTSTPTFTPPPASTSTRTPTQSAGPTFTRTPTSLAATLTRTPTQSSGPTLTRTPTSPATATSAKVIGTITFTPNADSYVDSSNSDVNYGSATTLRVDGSPVVRSYLRFDINGLSGTVQQATLRVFANSSSSIGYDIRIVSNTTWGETSLTYNNAPAVGNILGSYGSFSGGVWTSVDVTSYITGEGAYNLGLTTSGSTAISFASRESGANAPQLIIQTSGGATAVPTATRTSTPLSTGTTNPTASRTPTPNATSSGSVVLVGAGDISTCSNNNDEATAKLLDGISGTVFAAGDNVYDSGTYTEYTNCYDPTWGRHKARTKPVPGNHEYNTSGASGYFQYFNNVPAYYAYNLGGWRIYALNSEISASASSAQVSWLQADLAANPNQCALAYWHKPRWSSGNTHGSDSGMQTLWQVLYNAGVELVINGHEHNYERFAEMNASGSAASPGLREFVVGTGGMSHYSFGTALSASQVRNSSAYGVLKLTLRSNGYDWQFVPVAGSTFTDSGSANCH